MSFKIPTSLKREFKVGFDEYINKMGRNITAVMKPSSVQCPNCFSDNETGKSTNQYNLSFTKPVTIFPGTSSEQVIFPVPFNVTTVSGVQYNPDILDPKILTAAVCPVCEGEGKLNYENLVCLKCVVTVGKPQIGAEPSDFIDLSAGRDGMLLTRLKTFSKNYAVCRDALSFIVDGVEYKIEIPARLKGLGNKHITEVYLSTAKVDDSADTKYDSDSRINIVDNGQVSDQASDLTPTIPPTVPGDDVW